MNRHFSFTFCLLLLLSCHISSYAQSGTQSDTPDDPGAVIKVNIDLTVVDAVVMHRKGGQPVGGLTANDFRVYEDGVQQKIISLSQDKLPLSIVFLFDLTDSVRPVLKPLAQGALETLKHLKPEDEAAVMVYAASAQTLQEFTTDRQLVVAAIEKAGGMKSKEAAFFNEGIYQAASLVEKATSPGSRRVIIWLTDNVPNIPSEEIRQKYGRSVAEGQLHTEKQAFQKLFETGTVVCTLLERSLLSESSSRMALYSQEPVYLIPRIQNPPGDVDRYAQQTGGIVVVSNMDEISTKLADLIDRIRTRYSLGYHSSAAQPKGKFCKIVVKLSPELLKREGKLVVTAKQGYYR